MSSHLMNSELVARHTMHCAKISQPCFVCSCGADIAVLETTIESLSLKVKELREALEKIAAGSKLGTEMFERRVVERKNRLTWYAVNVLQDNLAACEGTARTALNKDNGLG